MLVGGALLASVPAMAEGALAVGSTGDVVADGIAFGYAVKYDSRSEARDAALKRCREYREAPKAADRCKVISSFTGTCMAIAMDPKAGTPGVGWAIAEDAAAAEDQAIAICEATAGRDRRGACKVDTSRCDR